MILVPNKNKYQLFFRAREFQIPSDFFLSFSLLAKIDISACCFLLQKTGAAKIVGGKGSAWQSVSISDCWTNLRSRTSRGRFRSLVTRFTHNHARLRVFRPREMHFFLLFPFLVSRFVALLLATQRLMSNSRFKSTMDYLKPRRERYFKQPPWISNSPLFIALSIVFQAVTSPFILSSMILSFFLFFFFNF